MKPIQQTHLKKFNELPAHEGKTGADLITTIVIYAGAYNECRAVHNGLVDFIDSIEYGVNKK